MRSKLTKHSWSLETFGRMGIGLWLLRSVRARPLDTGSSYSDNLPGQWEISFLNNRNSIQCFFFFFYQRPTVFSVTFCLTAILRAWQLSGRKRPSGRNLVEHRQGTTQWQHTERDHYQAYSSLLHFFLPLLLPLPYCSLRHELAVFDCSMNEAFRFLSV